MGELMAAYGSERAFVDGTASARLNAYMAGKRSVRVFEAERGELGLSAETAGRLLDDLRRWR